MNIPDKKLVTGCLKGNTKMQYALYNQYAPKMMGVCMRYSSDKDEANELLQTGFIKVFKNLNKYNSDGALGAWIRRVIVNNALDHIRKMKRIQVIDIEEHQNDFYINAEEDLNLALSEEVILSVLDGVKEEYKIIFNLHCIEKYSHKEIGAQLNIKEETSRSNLRRARKEIKEKLTEYLQKTRV